MKNKVFMKKTTEQKRRYLSDVLEYLSGGMLDDLMTRRILSKVAINKQYTVSAFYDNMAFQEAVASASSGKSRVATVFSQRRSGATVAVITPLGRMSEKGRKRVIYIHTPILHAGKGAEKWARAQRNA